MLDKILDTLQQHPNSDMQSMFGYLDAESIHEQRKVRRAITAAGKEKLIQCSADNSGKSLRMVYRLNGDDPPESTTPLRPPHLTRREKSHREKQKRANNRARKQLDNAALAQPIGTQPKVPESINNKTRPYLQETPNWSEKPITQNYNWPAHLTIDPNPDGIKAGPQIEIVPAPKVETHNVNEQQTPLQQRIDAELQSTSKLAHALRQNGRITNYELKIQVLTKLSELFSEDIDFVLAEISDDLRNYAELVGLASE